MQSETSDAIGDFGCNRRFRHSRLATGSSWPPSGHPVARPLTRASAAQARADQARAGEVQEPRHADAEARAVVLLCCVEHAARARRRRTPEGLPAAAPEVARTRLSLLYSYVPDAPGAPSFFPVPGVLSAPIVYVGAAPDSPGQPCVALRLCRRSRGRLPGVNASVSSVAVPLSAVPHVSLWQREAAQSRVLAAAPGLELRLRCKLKAGGRAERDLETRGCSLGT